jgi:hypothetical protein
MQIMIDSFRVVTASDRYRRFPIVSQCRALVPRRNAPEVKNFAK